MLALRTGRADSAIERSAAACSLVRALLTTGLAVVAMFAVLGVWSGRADAALSTSPLPGSSFQAADGNQDDPDGGGSLTDWQNYAGSAVTVLDAPLPGVGNDTFYSGKINEPDTWALETIAGGVTPGKANALASSVLLDPLTQDTFFYFSFIRESDSNAETHYSLELRKLTTTWVNSQGTTIPCRSNGDLLLVFAVNASTKNVTFSAFTWTSSAPGPAECPQGRVGTYDAVVLGANVQGHMNFDGAGQPGDITNYLATSVFGNTLEAGRFGEGAINLSNTIGAGSNPCFNFGEAQFFSLSSNSFASAMQDMITPAPISVRNCSATGTKWRDDNFNGTRDNGEPGLAGWTFWVDYDDDGVIDANEPSGVSGPTGAYTISGINPTGSGYPSNVSYRIHEKAPNGVTGYTCTYPGIATLGGGVDGHGCYWSATFATSGNQAGFDFGNAPPADLSVVKTPDTQTVDAGDAISFTMVTTNTGLGTAKGVTLSDPLPDGVDWTITAQTDQTDPLECSISGAGNDQVLSCAYGDLASGASRSVTVSATTSFDACAVYDNSATVDATNTPPDDDAGQITCLKPDLGTDKAALNVVVDAGDDVAFTITTTNGGPGTAKGVTLHDDLPAGVTWSISSQTDQTDPLECAVTGLPDAQDLDCAYGDLAAGESRTVTVIATTSFDSCAVYDNTATVDASNAPADSDSATISCQAPDLSVTKTPDGHTVNAGDPISFTIVTANGGPGTAKDVKLHDDLPTGVTWEIGSQSDQTVPLECAIGGAPGSQALACEYGDLASGASRTVTVTATTSFSACATYDNSATVSATNSPSDTDAGQITCRKPALLVMKTPASQTVDAGDPVSFTVITSNGGPGTAKDVKLHDDLPAGLTWAITSQSDQCAISGAPGSQDLDCNYGDLAVSVSRSVTVSAATSFEACTVYDNTATASAANAPSDSDDASVACRKPSVSIEKLTSTPTINAGDVAKFSVKVSNGGPGTAKDVVVEDLLPAGPVWSFDGAAPAGCSIADVSVGGSTRQKVTCSLASMAVTSFTFDVKATTSQADCAVYDNTATGTGSNTGPIVPASATVVCRKLPAISIDKSGPATAVAGDRVTYALAVTNSGPTSYAEGLVVVSDALCEAPPALSSKGADATPATLDPGETWLYTCTVQTQLGQTVVNNVGVVNGTDINGNKASALDGADTLLSQPVVAQAAPPVVVAGTAKLRGPSGCLLKPTAKVSVTGRQILSVRFVLDKKTLKTVTKPDKQGRFSVTIVRKKAKPGSHRVQAIVRFKPASKTKARTLQLRFSRCGEVKPARAKGFTG